MVNNDNQDGVDLWVYLSAYILFNNALSVGAFFGIRSLIKLETTYFSC